MACERSAALDSARGGDRRGALRVAPYARATRQRPPAWPVGVGESLVRSVRRGDHRCGNRSRCRCGCPPGQVARAGVPLSWGVPAVTGVAHFAGPGSPDAGSRLQWCQGCGESVCGPRHPAGSRRAWPDDPGPGARAPGPAPGALAVGSRLRAPPSAPRPRRARCCGWSRRARRRGRPGPRWGTGGRPAGWRGCRRCRSR